MRPQKLFGLAFVLIATSVVSFTASSASAEMTTLCGGDPSGSGCGSAVTHVHETTLAGVKAKLLTSIVNVECDVLFLGNTVEPLGEPLFILGNLTYTSCGSCTVEETGEGVLVEVLKLGHETADVTGEGEIHVNCSGLNCYYSEEGLLGTAKGPLLSSETNGQVQILEQKVTKVKGLFCPSTSKLDITTTPLSATYIGSSAGIGDATKFGLTNNVTPNIHNCFRAAPVNCATGNQTESQTDLLVGGRPGLNIIRTYNSQLAANQKTAGSFGYGWTASYSSYLEINKEAGTAVVHQDNGSTAGFELKEGKYTAPSWVQASLTKEGENYVFIPPDQTKWEFNSSGKLTKITDRHSLAITLAYNAKGQLESATDPASRKLVFTYNAGGQVESIKDPMGHVVKYTYESGNLATIVLPGEEKARWKFAYNASHELTSMTDGRSNTTTTSYDASHRVISQTVPPERKYKWEYKEAGGVKETTITEPNGSVTIEKFNAAGEPLTTTQASGTEAARTTTYEYDWAYNLIALTDPNKHTTEYTYDSKGNRLSEIDPNGHETKWTYNSTHDVESITTPKGMKTEFGPNEAGDVEWIFREGPGEVYQETSMEYDKYGDLISRTDPLGRKTTYTYDAIPLVSYPGTGNLLSETDPESDKRTWSYNTNSQPTSEVSPRGNEKGAEASKFKTTIEYNALGRKTSVTDPLEHTLKYTYDANGNLETLIDANGRTTTYTYNAADERTKAEAPNGDTTETAYDSMGQVTSQTNGSGNVTKYIRDALEQVTEVVDPLERKTTNTYDSAGNLVKVKDAEGRTTTYTYDSANRLTKVDYSEEATPDVSFEYDKDGNVVTMKDGTGTTKKTYDPWDRLTEVENGNKEVVKYEYNLGEEITKITYPNGKSITRILDKAGRLEKVKDWLGGETKFSYNTDSALTATTFPSGTTSKDEYQYNNADQLTKTTMLKEAETLASLTYTRDKLGQLEKTTQTGLPGEEKLEYAYDENNRLTKGAGTSFEYDKANNATKLGTSTLKYDKASQLEEGGGVKYAFNKVGQRTKATPETGPTTTYGYDQVGNLASVKRPEEGKVSKIEDSYAYDGTGLRISQSINGSTTHMVWNTAEKLPLLLNDGTSSYVYGPDGAPLEQINSKEEVLYLHHDQQGSVRLLTGTTGTSQGAYSYTPFGSLEAHTGSATTALGYGGQYTNADTGLIYLRARTYDPATAQFLSIDPKVVETGEPYSYASDSPANLGDPTGLLVYGLCGSAKAGLPGLSMGGTGCVIWNNTGEIGVAGFLDEPDIGIKTRHDAFDAGWTSAEIGHTLSEIIEKEGADPRSWNVGSWVGLAKNLFSGEVGGFYSDASSIYDLNNTFESERDTFTLGFWHKTTRTFWNDSGIAGIIVSVGENSLWFGSDPTVCGESRIHVSRIR
jgi:RHS repeat-associated protein